jgi:DNA-binding NarL/FixJ family response regulator
VPTIEALQRTAPGAHILAYVSHTNATAIQQARSAGVDKVLARSAFVTGLADILRSA